MGSADRGARAITTGPRHDDNNLRVLAEQAANDVLDSYLIKLLETVADHFPRTDLLGWFATIGADLVRFFVRVFHPTCAPSTPASCRAWRRGSPRSSPITSRNTGPL